jgi:hypothetical protein
LRPDPPCSRHLRPRSADGDGQPARRHALAEIDPWLSKIGADIIPVVSDLADLATHAWLTYGKGRHPAALDFADCFSYALAKRGRTAAIYKPGFLPDEYRGGIVMARDPASENDLPDTIPSPALPGGL